VFAAEPNVRLALCVGADVLPADGNREILYNLISDGACAALVEPETSVNRIVSYAQTTKGFYWDSAERENEIIAAYFPTARAVIQEALDHARLTIDDIRLIIPHNVNRSSWRLLLSLLGAPKEKFFGRNIGARGHTISADNIMNLADAVRLGRVRTGDYVMLFTFGFGAHWACVILQH
jgi:3-oxoacyl-[acyl-carrier-protein] synthase-3